MVCDGFECVYEDSEVRAHIRDHRIYSGLVGGEVFIIGLPGLHFVGVGRTPIDRHAGILAEAFVCGLTGVLVGCHGG